MITFKSPRSTENSSRMALAKPGPSVLKPVQLPSLSEDDGVNGPHHLGGGIHKIASFKSFEFMRDSDIDPMDSCVAKLLECVTHLVCFHLDADIPGIFSQIIKCRLMKLRGQRMFNWVADDCKNARASCCFYSGSKVDRVCNISCDKIYESLKSAKTFLLAKDRKNRL